MVLVGRRMSSAGYAIVVVTLLVTASFAVEENQSLVDEAVATVSVVAVVVADEVVARSAADFKVDTIL